MDWRNKVVWSQGMFLRPQHFQQQDRYIEALVQGRVDGIRGHAWGVAEIEINRELLAIGQFGLTRCRGVLPDGTPFNIPDETDHPPTLDLPENTRDSIIYLTLPARQPGGVEVTLRDDEGAARYLGSEFCAVDAVAGSGLEAQVNVGKLRLRFKTEVAERAGYVCIGLARVVEVRADKMVVLDDRYIAPCLNCGCQSPLLGFVTELNGLFHHRGEALAARITAPGAKGASDVQDFMLLQVVNRYQPLLAHFAADAWSLHPEALFAQAVSIAGELATFASQNKRALSFPEYRHDDLKQTFAPVIAELRRELSAVIEQNAVAIPLHERQYGIRVAIVTERSLFTNAVFVLVVKASVANEMLRRNFPNQAKVGPVEKITQLVRVALPGIALQPLPVAPRQLPFQTGAVYFEFDRSGDLWKEMQKPGGSGGLAIFVGADWPGLEMELWAIRASS
ncbi:MAG: type VI secretion system baseplate subunit TssK [Stellaceae bacterium]